MPREFPYEFSSNCQIYFQIYTNFPMGFYQEFPIPFQELFKGTTDKITRIGISEETFKEIAKTAEKIF